MLYEPCCSRARATKLPPPYTLPMKRASNDRHPVINNAIGMSRLLYFCLTVGEDGFFGEGCVGRVFRSESVLKGVRLRLTCLLIAGLAGV